MRTMVVHVKNKPPEFSATPAMDSVVMYQGNTELHSISTYFDPEGNDVSITIHQDLGPYISFDGRKGFVFCPNVGT